MFKVQLGGISRINYIVGGGGGGGQANKMLELLSQLPIFMQNLCWWCCIRYITPSPSPSDIFFLHQCLSRSQANQILRWGFWSQQTEHATTIPMSAPRGQLCFQTAWLCSGRFMKSVAWLGGSWKSGCKISQKGSFIPCKVHKRGSKSHTVWKVCCCRQSVPLYITWNSARCLVLVLCKGLMADICVTWISFIFHVIIPQELLCMGVT